jgi:hypothetical protein
MTKKEVTQIISDAGMADMLASTVSCTRPRSWTVKQKHCGLCSQCIDRRFAVLAAGLEQHEPSENYKRDLLLGDRSTDDDLRMALSYVAFFRNVAAMSRERFLVEFPEIVSALDHFPDLSVDEAGARVFDLFQRHARSVEEVVTQAVKEHGDRLYRGEVPSGSLLAACFSRDHVEIAPASSYDEQATALIDRLSAPVLEFAVDDDAEQVLFHGGHHLEGANYRFVKALIDGYRNAKRTRSEIPFMTSVDVAERMGVTDQSMRQQLRRLRDAIDPLAVMLGIPLDQHSFVETKERAGYRLNPTCREISVGDIQDQDPAASSD